MIDYAQVLIRRHAGLEWILNGNDYEGLVMLDDSQKPTKKMLDEAWPEVEAEIKAEQAARHAAETSARTKLKALGLTDAEVAALVG